MISKRNRWILVLISLAFLPFLMRVGLDTDKIRAKAVDTLYSRWHNSEVASVLSSFDEINYKGSIYRTEYHHHFQKSLSKDYMLHGGGEYPALSVEFSEGDFLWALVSIESSPGVFHYWHGEERMVNNGYLIGVWLAAFCLIAGFSIWVCTSVFSLFSLLWATHWNPLSIPELLYLKLSDGFRELATRGLSRESAAFLVAMSAVPFFLVMKFFLKKLFKNKIKESIKYKTFVISLIAEPIVIASFFGLYNWSNLGHWWKVYLFSIAGRFFTISIIAYFILNKKFSLNLPKLNYHKPLQYFYLSLLLPFFFYVCYGWDWLSVLAASKEASVLMSLKVFATAFLLSLVIGSRFFSLMLGILVFPLMLDVTQTPNEIALKLGLFLEGLVCGWVFSPWMSGFSPWRVFVPTKVLTVVMLNSMVIGVVLTSVGIPHFVAWILIAMVTWGFYNLELYKLRTNEV